MNLNLDNKFLSGLLQNSFVQNFINELAQYLENNFGKERNQQGPHLHACHKHKFGRPFALDRIFARSKDGSLSRMWSGIDNIDS